MEIKAAEQKLTEIEETLAAIDEVTTLISAFTMDQEKQMLVASILNNMDDIKSVVGSADEMETIVSDLLKGNYLGNRKIDINLLLNRSNADSVVSYYKADIVLTDGQILQIPFMGGGAVMELTSHSDIRNYIVNDTSYKTMVEYTECIYEEAIGTNSALLRFRDADGHSSNIERVILYSYSGSPIEINPTYYWAKTTSALQTIANRIGDIIALGNDVENIVALAQRIDELNELQSKLEELMIVFVNINNIATVARDTDEINALSAITIALSTLNTNIAALQNLNANMTSIQNVSSNIASVAMVANKDIVIQNVYNNLAMLQTTYDNLVTILQADDNATLASTKASEASTSAASAQVFANTATTQAGIATTQAGIATARANEIKAITAQAVTGAPGSNSGVSYNSADGKFTFVIPQGSKGDKGDSFTVNATGTYANRTTYNTQPAGFTYVATDLGQIYFKNSATSADWSVGSPFGKGDKGDIGDTGVSISSIVRVSGNGTSGSTDTYRITFTNGGTSDFNVYNGADSDLSAADLLVHTTNVSNPHSVTKAQVGLGNVDNTADSVKNVSSAAKLTTGRSIALTGDVIGSATFDGSAGISIATTVTDNSHNHGNSTITDVDWSKISSKPDPVVTVTLTGDVTGSANTTLTDLASGTISIVTTVAPNSVALGTDTTGTYVSDVTAGSYITKSGTAGEAWSPTLAVDATSTNTASKVVARDSNGNFSAGTITASLTGNSSTSTTLATARTINGVSFNGSADIDIEDRIGTAIASAATINIGASGTRNTVHITGTTAITSLGVSTTGIKRTLIFDGALTLTHNATSLILPAGISIVTVAGDVAEFVCENGVNGYWTCIDYQRKSGTPLTLGGLNTTGSAATLTTARTINGVPFNGSANINIEDRLGTAIASATTTTIGTGGLGNYIHITGTTTITSFGTASSAGIRRTLIFDSALTITHNATSLICVGASNIVTVAGTVIEVIAETTANWRVVSIMHPSLSMAELGYLDGATSNIQTQINGRATTSSPTFTGTPIAPTPAQFDNDTSIATTEFVKAKGVEYSTAISFVESINLINAYCGALLFLYNTAPQNANLPLVSQCPSGATFTLTNNNVGTWYLNRAGTDTIFMGEQQVTSVGITAGATVTVMSRGDYWVVVSGNANTLGYGQAWTNMTTSRALETAYINTSGRPIMIAVTAQSTIGSNLIISGVCQTYMDANKAETVYAIIPNGTSYSVSVLGGTKTLVYWAELR